MLQATRGSVDIDTPIFPQDATWNDEITVVLWAFVCFFNVVVLGGCVDNCRYSSTCNDKKAKMEKREAKWNAHNYLRCFHKMEINAGLYCFNTELKMKSFKTKLSSLFRCYVFNVTWWFGLDSSLNSVNKCTGLITIESCSTEAN